MSNDTVWRRQVQASAGNDSEVVLIPAWVDQVAATCLPGGGGSARIQHTMDDPTSITNWVDWDEGIVTVATSQALMGIATALRLSAIGQTATMQVVGVRKRQ
jgi:hypothetical protein